MKYLVTTIAAVVLVVVWRAKKTRKPVSSRSIRHAAPKEQAVIIKEPCMSLLKCQS